MEIDSVEFAINKCLGIDNNNNILTGGLIQRLNLTKDKVDYLRTLCSESMNKGISWVDMWRSIDLKYLEIVENENFEPINIFCQDLSNVEHRLTKLAEAQRLKMTHFIYAGGLNPNSRDFCVHNNGRIFNLNEIKDWSLQPFAKEIPFYTPILDFGGRGCHHCPDFITEDLALALKEKHDLRADENEKKHKAKKKQ